MPEIEDLGDATETAQALADRLLLAGDPNAADALRLARGLQQIAEADGDVPHSADPTRAVLVEQWKELRRDAAELEGIMLERLQEIRRIVQVLPPPKGRTCDTRRDALAALIDHWDDLNVCDDRAEGAAALLTMSGLIEHSPTGNAAVKLAREVGDVARMANDVERSKSWHEPARILYWTGSLNEAAAKWVAAHRGVRIPRAASRDGRAAEGALERVEALRSRVFAGCKHRHTPRLLHASLTRLCAVLMDAHEAADAGDGTFSDRDVLRVVVAMSAVQGMVADWAHVALDYRPKASVRPDGATA
jgi:hypothetical protein